MASVCGVVGLALLVAQVANLGAILDPQEILSAAYAKALLLGYAVAVVGLVGSATVLPERLRWLPVAAGGAIAIVTLTTTLLIGGELWSLLGALLTMAACWQVGTWMLHRVPRSALVQSVPVAWLAGAGALGMVTLFAGRAGLLRWWTLGVPVLVIGGVGLLHLGNGPAQRAGDSAWRAVVATRLSCACAAFSVLLLGLAAVWVAAPDLMFDSLYAKVWLPSEWARLGAIEPQTVHPVLNVTGFAQVLAVPGHLTGAEGVGRYLQWLSAAGVVVGVWWAARRSAWAPLAAAIVALTPHLFWQSATAFDDAVLTLVAVAFAIALLSAIERPGDSALSASLVLGGLAGVGIDFKLHLAPLMIGGGIGWLLQRRHDRPVLRATGFAVGGLAAAAPPFVLRWIDVGNPVIPAYNDIFKSEYWPPIDDKLNFPFLAEPGALGPLNVLVKSATDTLALNEAAPSGAFGLLIGALVCAIVLAWRGSRDGPSLRPFWLALVLAFVAWYVQFRYLRYLVPAGVVAVLVVAWLSSDRPLSRGMERFSLAGLAVAAVLFWPATVAQFWNVPGKDVPWDAAIGLRSETDYERSSMPEVDALDSFDRVAPPAALALSDAHQRLWLSDGRDLAPQWEVDKRLRARGPVPTGARETLRDLRLIGVEWVVALDGGDTHDRPYVDPLLTAHGQVEWSDVGWTVYRLVDRPRQSTALPACDDLLAGIDGCWAGTLDGEPGFRAEESPAGVSRVVPLCPGRTLRVDVRTTGGTAPMTIAIDFDGDDARRGHARLMVAPDARGRAQATAPPGATQATVALIPLPGMTVDSARFGTVGSCST